MNDATRTPTRFLVFPIWILAIYAAGALMREAAPIFLWVTSAFFIFVLLDPAAQKLKTHGWPVALSSMVLILLATITIGGTLYLLGHLLAGLVAELEQSRKVFVETFNDLSGYWTSINDRIAAFHPADSPVHQGIQKVEVVQPSPLGGDVGGTILQGLGNAVSVFTFAVLVPILAFFFLAERDAMARTIARAYDDETVPGRAWAKIVSATFAFFFGNFLLGVITYPLFAILLYFFSVPSVMVTAALATFLNLVPFAGAVLAGLLPAVGLYTQTQAFAGPLALYGACFVIHLVVADFITPKVLGKQVNINATTSTVALVAWGELWGGLGLVLAIPITSVIKIMFEHSDYFWLKWIAGLMSENADASLAASRIAKPPGDAPAEA